MESNKKIGCRQCSSSGRIMGLGCMTETCKVCKGKGFTNSEEEIKTEKVNFDKRSKSYKEAIKEIKKLNPKLTDEEAQKEFDKIAEEV